MRVFSQRPPFASWELEAKTAEERRQSGTSLARAGGRLRTFARWNPQTHSRTRGLLIAQASPTTRTAESKHSALSDRSEQTPSTRAASATTHRERQVLSERAQLARRQVLSDSADANAATSDGVHGLSNSTTHRTQRDRVLLDAAKQLRPGRPARGSRRGHQ